MDIEQRIKETQEGLLEKHDLVLNDEENSFLNMG